ncbi:hypothetical protein HYW35_00060 [Candidatus Saccharibacteria bacterium]|nr:hypothetical protein [Candidatus Saccharibacteria bacterium]
MATPAPKGFSHFVLLLVIIILGVVGFGGWRAYSSKSNDNKKGSSYQIKTSASDAKLAKITWTDEGGSWQPSGTPPNCPDPLVKFPVDLSLATSILYPGQYRGGDYKPHGGFRFDNNANNDLTVTAPMDADVIRGARYPVNGETQYVFDFIAACGYMYRFGHMLSLSPKLQAIADKLPQNREGDSRDTRINPPLSFKAGETLATAVGIVKGDRNTINVFVDWGMYDLRSKNEASKNADWAAKHPSNTEQYAVCWFDLLGADEEAKVRALPSSDSQSGKTSDYCK